jgi:G3E family GTPase
MNLIRFVMIGGFLGAGKTTTIAQLAKLYQSRGLKVGIVTNDQAADLVDTNTLRSQGLAVEEVAGACFCCRFEDLVDRVGKLQLSERPDVVLAEPVGSCTDLVATVVQPLKDLYNSRFEVAPYPVLFKPSHGLKILRREQGQGFSPKAEYIFLKQLEEADAIVLNRVDELSASDIEELSKLVGERFPGVPVLKMSAKTGQGLDALVELLTQKGNFGRKILDIDYDIYAEGEAELGWLNSAIRVNANGPIDVDQLLLQVVDRLQGVLAAEGAEVAHLKAIGLMDGPFGVANLVASGTKAELSLPAKTKTAEMDLIVNARVAIDPQLLEEKVREVVTAVCTGVGAKANFGATQSFRPGRPTPTHRYATASA